MAKRVFYLLILFLLFSGPLSAQEAAGPVQVFVVRGQTDQVQFLDMLTGEITSVEVNGERFTLFGRAVMFYDPDANRVMLATPDGRVRNHPFIQPPTTSRRVDWALSADGTQVAWTLTSTQTDGQLITATQVAGIDGSSPRSVLTDGPRVGIRALPVAFSPAQDRLYMDYQPDGIGDVTPFRQYAGLFEVDIETGEMTMLPDEPGCFCGAGLGMGLLLRLELAENLSGFDAVVTNLAAETVERFPAVGLANFTQAGAVSIAPDSTQAVYALAQVRDFGGFNQSVRTVFVRVDLVERAQSILTQPIANFAVPVEWTEDNSAVIIATADATANSTWKLTLEDGRLTRVANAAYLGTLR
jgi:hypothetical protein